ncbi:MAG: 7,8-didemethyl-8-hydroxy-5-deazariboflavin synthase subunit CofG [Promethearchaeota archaeon]|nr:MAG: 7,8-didemethyl-8-hydroxy-5-deazariboflavin synthase subunit CofG [Candidatus Lokiarchaeota archaeon]
MSVSSQRIKELKSLSLRKIRQEVYNIRKELNKEHNKIITYSKNFTISLSNYCRNQCGYCFYNHRVPKDHISENIILISNSDLESLIIKAKKYNCKEALLMSGEEPEQFQIVRDYLKKRGFKSYIDFLIEISNILLDNRLLPHTNIGIIDFEHLRALKSVNASMGLMLESTCEKLSMQGGVHEFSPGKLPKKRIEFIENAGKLKIPFTTGLLLGIGEDENDRIKDLFLIYELHKKYGHIQEIIIQNYREKHNIQYHPRNPISIKEILKTIGIAKLIMGNDIEIQVPPNLLKGYEKEAISMGISDFGGISPITIDYINPYHPWPQVEYLTKICKKEGYELKERLPIYEKFIKKDGFCSEKIRSIIKKVN